MTVSGLNDISKPRLALQSVMKRYRYLHLFGAQWLAESSSGRYRALFGLLTLPRAPRFVRDSRILAAIGRSAA